MSAIDATAPRRAGEGDPANERAELRQAAAQFESLFLQMLIERMREAQLEGGFFGGATGASTYEGLFSEFLGQHLADRSPLGLADLLVERWAGDEGGTERARKALAELDALRARGAYDRVLDEAAAAETPISPENTGIPQVPASGPDKEHVGRTEGPATVAPGSGPGRSEP